MTRIKPTYIFKDITRNVFILGLVSLFTDLSSQMVFPLIPLFLTVVIGAGADIVGAIEGAAESTASLLKVVSGYWSDKIRKRKRFVLLGYSLSSLAKPLFALANSWAFVLSIRVIERIGKGIRTAPRDALVAESSDEHNRGKAYGFHRAMDGVGSVLGALAAYWLLPVLGYRNIFLFAIFPSVLAIFSIMFIQEATEAKSTQISKGNGSNSRLKFGQLPTNLRVFIASSSLFSLGHFGYAFLLLKANSIGLADQSAILLYVLFYMVYTLCTIPFGSLSDRIGRKPVLMMGYSIFVLTSLGLVFASSFNSVLLFFVTYGVFYAMIDGTQRAFVADLAPDHLKATSLGMFHTAIGLVALPGGVIAGLLWEKAGPEFTFAYGAGLTVVSMLLFLFVQNNDPATPPPQN